MKVGDLVKLSHIWSSHGVVEDWGYGFIDEVYDLEGNVEVIWPQKSWTSRTIPKGRVEVVSESQ